MVPVMVHERVEVVAVAEDATLSAWQLSSLTHLQRVHTSEVSFSLDLNLSSY